MSGFVVPQPVRVKMTRDFPIAVRGIRPAVGDVVVVPDTCARVLVAEGYAEAAR